MSHELTMLRGYKRMRKLYNIYAKEARVRAVKSHTDLTAQGGTMGQIEGICAILRLRDACSLFCKAVADGLTVIDNEFRKLLTHAYILRIPADILVLRYGISRSALYRKLQQARRQFKRALINLGFDEYWLANNYADYFIANRNS